MRTNFLIGAVIASAFVLAVSATPYCITDAEAGPSPAAFWNSTNSTVGEGICNRYDEIGCCSPETELQVEELINGVTEFALFGGEGDCCYDSIVAAICGIMCAPDNLPAYDASYFDETNPNRRNEATVYVSQSTCDGILQRCGEKEVLAGQTLGEFVGSECNPAAALCEMAIDFLPFDPQNDEPSIPEMVFVVGEKNPDIYTEGAFSDANTDVGQLVLDPYYPTGASCQDYEWDYDPKADCDEDAIVDGKSKLSTGAIVAIAAGGAVLIGGVVFALVFIGVCGASAARSVGNAAAGGDGGNDNKKSGKGSKNEKDTEKGRASSVSSSSTSHDKKSSSSGGSSSSSSSE